MNADEDFTPDGAGPDQAPLAAELALDPVLRAFAAELRSLSEVAPPVPSPALASRLDGAAQSSFAGRRAHAIVGSILAGAVVIGVSGAAAATDRLPIVSHLRTSTHTSTGPSSTSGGGSKTVPAAPAAPAVRRPSQSGPHPGASLVPTGPGPSQLPGTGSSGSGSEREGAGSPGRSQAPGEDRGGWTGSSSSQDPTRSAEPGEGTGGSGSGDSESSSPPSSAPSSPPGEGSPSGEDRHHSSPSAPRSTPPAASPSEPSRSHDESGA
ncbi:hypothetical protein M6D93_13900 [Jatrophihabitans telluris]|uniref:Uncharacterized protein n=1 Tax=Jatrophihabitans telluris TaxID=2038343 RepID=A0ABY4QVP0_9ACTN|nr:hypothetical protein [Jatrophihabitans telluris]UQX87388.1 hypothetical protein M6D93_13900 [Jatrophihabitans telluris]